MSRVGALLVRLDAAGTASFVIAVVVALVRPEVYGAQVAVAAVSLMLFGLGVAASIWAYAVALDRSRTDEIGVANLYLLTGSTAPPSTKRTCSALLAIQVVVSFAGAMAGLATLEGDDTNTLAFGVLVPMFGIGMNGLWAARYGSFGPRGDRSAAPSNRRIE